MPKILDSGLPSGIIRLHAGTTVPSDWLLCDGSAISRTTYADLFSSISTTYGTGDGSTTFNIPDFRGMFLRGAGTHGTQKMADGSTYFAGGSVGTYNADQMQGHNHSTVGAYDTGGSTYGAMTTSIGNTVNRTSGQTNGFLSYMVAMVLPELEETPNQHPIQLTTL